MNPDKLSVSNGLPPGFAGNKERHHVEIAGFLFLISEDGAGGHCWCLKYGAEVIQ